MDVCLSLCFLHSLLYMCDFCGCFRPNKWYQSVGLKIIAVEEKRSHRG